MREDGIGGKGAGEPAASDWAPWVLRGSAPLRVAVVARQVAARVGWRELLDGREGLRVVGGVAFDAPEDARRLQAEVALVATDAADLDPARELLERLAEAGVPSVLVGSSLSASDLSALLGAGARGVLTDDASADDVAAALWAAARGLLVLTPSLVGGVQNPTRAPHDTVLEDLAPEEALTEREQEVLELLALGLPNKAIARRLSISDHTVKFHVGSILAKLGAESRTEAVTRAARRGLLAL